MYAAVCVDELARYGRLYITPRNTHIRNQIYDVDTAEYSVAYGGPLYRYRMHRCKKTLQKKIKKTLKT